ncbi:MAG: glycosyltransferase family 4 protein [Candidatus Paceibacterota bacterium]
MSKEVRRILVFSTAYLPLTGGAELAVDQIAKRLSEFEFSLITARLKRSLPKEEKVGAVHVYRVGFGFKLDKLLLPFLGARKAKKLSAQNTYQKYWALMASQGALACARLKGRNENVKMVLTLQEGDTEKHLLRYTFGSKKLFKLLIKPLYSSIFHLADQVTVISNWLRKRAEKNGFRGEISLVPNGVDLELFTKEVKSEQKEALYKEHGLNKDKKYIITTSRLVEKNDIESLVRAVKLLPEDIELLVLGTGPLKTRLENVAVSLDIKKRIHFLGQIAYEKLPDYLALAKVFCRPSLSEGMGNSFIESMAASVPVLATNGGGIPDFLFDNQTGFFVEVKNPESIAEKVKLVLKDEKQTKKVVEAAKQLVSERYSWDVVASKMKEVFEN